ncbi:MAG TPA: hypothetical protein VHM64_16640 [Candidatus Binatia bacterium]|nr:hypothetical protein [Candidatus Binatia bacterium]
MGLFDDKSETRSGREGQAMGKNNDSLFDWLVRKAEADLGVAQALAVCEAQRTDQIKQLESALVGQISELQYQVIETREAELMDLKSEISACAERIARFETTATTAKAAKQAVQELENISGKLTARQTELEGRHTGLEKLAEALGSDIRALQEDLKDKLDGIKSVQAETRHFQSETRSLADRIAQAESVTWQFRTLALRNAEQLEQTTGSLNSEIASLNTSVAELNKKQRELRLPNILLQELGAKIEEIQERINQAQNGQAERDVRLGHLDSGLCTLAERMAQLEELAGRNHSLIQAEMNSAAGFRNRTAEELSAIGARLNDPAIHRNLQELELRLSAKIQESQHHAAQKFMLLEARETEREKQEQELSAALDARFAEHEARTDEKLRVVGNDHEELCRVRPEIQKLAERFLALNSAIDRTQAQADASAGGLARLENHLSGEMTGLRAEVEKIAEQQRAFRPAHDDLCEIERKLSGALQDIQRQVAIEREGLDHWAKGLRESFAAELIGVQARLSERLSQIEHRYTGLERSHEAVETSIAGLQSQLQTNLQSQRVEDQPLRKVVEDLTVLAERMSHIERGAAQAEERMAGLTRDVEQHVGALKHEIRILANSLDQPDLSSFDSIVRGLDEKLGARLGEIEERFTNRLSHYNQDVSDRIRQSEETASRAEKELVSLRTALETQNTGSSALTSSPALNEVLCTKIGELEQRLAAQFNLIENRDAERAQRFTTISERLESELATLKSNFNQGAEASYASSMAVLRESIDKQMQHVQQHFAEKLHLIENRVEQTASAFITETGALRAELTNLSGASAPVASLVRGLEDKLTAKIEELRNHVGERLSAFDRREAEIKELAERAQTVMYRLPDRGADIARFQNMPVAAVQTLTPRVEAIGERAAASGSIKAEESARELQARSEKEQLIKLQERMSAEIERVRAELKERSGRWKVRKTAS